MNQSYSSPCIAIIDPAVKNPAISSFNELSRYSPYHLTYHAPYLHGMTSCLVLEQPLAGVLLLGSNLSVNDDNQQSELLNAYLWHIIDEGIPLFGICYGHQFIANMFGCRVEHCFKSKKRLGGTRKITIYDDTSLKISRRTSNLVVSHCEAVISTTDELEVFASSEHIKYEGLRHKKHKIWSLQAHPEATQTFLREVLVPIQMTRELKHFGYSIILKFLDFCIHNWQTQLKPKTPTSIEM